MEEAEAIFLALTNVDAWLAEDRVELGFFFEYGAVLEVDRGGAKEEVEKLDLLEV